MQPSDSLRLVLRRGPQPNQAFEIKNDITTLGRDISNDIVINDRETSRNHLRLMRSGDSVTLEDLGSTNGTFVNGKRVSGITPLQHGDMIGLGETVTLALEAVAQEAEPAPIVPPEGAETPLPLMPPPSGDLPAPQEYGLQGSSPSPDAPYAPGAEAYPQQPPAKSPFGDAAAPGQYPAAQGGQTPPAPPQGYPGYEYDPYAVREEGGGTSPWLILGCFVFFVLVFVCFAGIALVIVDELCLWFDIPVLRDIVNALGYFECAP